MFFIHHQHHRQLLLTTVAIFSRWGKLRQRGGGGKPSKAKPKAKAKAAAARRAERRSTRYRTDRCVVCNGKLTLKSRARRGSLHAECMAGVRKGENTAVALGSAVYHILQIIPLIKNN